MFSEIELLRKELIEQKNLHDNQVQMLLSEIEALSKSQDEEVKAIRMSAYRPKDISVPLFGENGAKEDIYSWIFLVEQAFLANYVEEGRKSLVAGSKLRGAALQLYRKLCLVSQPTWNLLKEELKKLYIPVDSQQRLRSCHQQVGSE